MEKSVSKKATFRLSSTIIENENIAAINAVQDHWNEACMEVRFLEKRGMFTILQASIILDKPQVARHMLDQDELNPDALSADGRTLPIICAQKECPLDILGLVISKCDLKFQDTNGKTALEYAREDWPGYRLLNGVPYDEVVADNVAISISQDVEEQTPLIIEPTKKSKSEKKSKKASSGEESPGWCTCCVRRKPSKKSKSSKEKESGM